MAKLLDSNIAPEVLDNLKGVDYVIDVRWKRNCDLSTRLARVYRLYWFTFDNVTVRIV